MRKIWLMFMMLVATWSVNAQAPGMGGNGRQRASGLGGGQGASIGHFYGKVVDSRTDKGIDGVSVQLIQSKFDTVTRKRRDTVISGMITGRKGDFSMENLPLFGN